MEAHQENAETGAPIKSLLELEAERIGADGLEILLVDSTPASVCIEFNAGRFDNRFRVDLPHWKPADLVKKLGAWYELQDKDQVTKVDYLQVVKGALSLRLKLVNSN